MGFCGREDPQLAPLQTDRRTDRQTDGQLDRINRQTHRQTDRQTHRHRHTDTDKHTDTQTHTHRHTHTLSFHASDLKLGCCVRVLLILGVGRPEKGRRDKQQRHEASSFFRSNHGVEGGLGTRQAGVGEPECQRLRRERSRRRRRGGCVLPRGC